MALLTAYSYAKLSVAYPSRGGTVTFLDRAFGSGMVTGSLNVLLWLSYVVMLSLYAFAFGSYGATFLPPAWQAPGKHVLISLVVAAITGLNLLSARADRRGRELDRRPEARDPASVRRRGSRGHRGRPDSRQPPGRRRCSWRRAE